MAWRGVAWRGVAIASDERARDKEIERGLGGCGAGGRCEVTSPHTTQKNRKKRNLTTCEDRSVCILRLTHTINIVVANTLMIQSFI